MEEESQYLIVVEDGCYQHYLSILMDRVNKLMVVLYHLRTQRQTCNIDINVIITRFWVKNDLVTL